MAQRENATHLCDSPGAYGLISRVNHWIIAAGMIGVLASGLFMAYGPLAPQELGTIRDWHKAVGVLVLGYGLWRVGWRLVHGFPDTVATMPRWQEASAKIAHWGLLGSILVMPISGILKSVYAGRSVQSFFGLVIPAQEKIEWIVNAAANVHHYAGWVLVALLFAHIGGALKHHFIDRDTTLRRMIRG